MKRFTATEKWQKDWFQSLTPGQKCLWNYLCDNCDAAGVWEPNWRLASFVINENFTGSSLDVFGARVRALPGGKIWLTGFCEFQYSHLSRDCRAHTHIIRSLEKHHLLTEVEYLFASPGTADYPSDTLWHKVEDRDKEKDTDKEKEPERVSPTATASAKAPGTPLPPSVVPPSPAKGRAVASVPTVPTVPCAPSPGGKPSPDLVALNSRVGAIMRRRPGSRWSERERSAAAALFPLDENDLLLVERYYSAEIAPPEDIRRRDLLTLLNHWPGEIDRARSFWRKRGWRLPASADDPPEGSGAAAETKAVMPEGFDAWKAQASEYAGTVWRDWPAVPGFARAEFLRWRKSR